MPTTITRCKLTFDSLGSYDLKVELYDAIDKGDLDEIIELLSKLEKIAAELASDDYGEINSLFKKATQIKRLSKL